MVEQELKVGLGMNQKYAQEKKLLAHQHHQQKKIKKKWEKIKEWREKTLRTRKQVKKEYREHLGLILLSFEKGVYASGKIFEEKTERRA